MSQIESEKIPKDKDQFSKSEEVMDQSQDNLSSASSMKDESWSLQSFQFKKKISKCSDGKKTYKRGRKPKLQMKKIAYTYSSTNLQELTQIQSKLQYETSIIKQIPSQKVFFLAGDILAELKDATNDMGIDIFREQRNALFIERDNYGTQFELTSVSPLKNFQSVIYYQENSQDQELYQFSKFLKKHQELIYMLSAQIQDLQNSFLCGDQKLEEIINKRQNIKNQQRKQILEQIYNQDRFCQIATVSLSLTNQTTTVSNISFSQSMIALLGFESDNVLCNVSKIAFLKVLTQNSRRQIMKCNIQAQQKQQSGLILEIEDFELLTFDQIKIVCKGRFQTIPIIYPPELQFEQYPLLNTIEQFCLVEYDITPWHIEQLLKIRQEFIKKAPQNEIFPNNYKYSNLIEIENFEYSIQSQIFLEKYYQKELKKINENNQKQIEQQLQIEQIVQNPLPCGFRYI
ncbi:hypothetical protein TTHERM_00770620 (macronuclear) [Tetrahymena thermophila SB210]|uniref:Uncharacterized protein n=1 Tax=Tetrahymena thermophila (strain SB210) TaxID=312017 RepID=Q23AT3_TETTS|nr:hypothetical protein TTHERM_00770620 [Tetrahymena thermophila SB210]EAR93609.1 hypothetical protein TTHERM_00770620 [Tetrahymena thermophila SB210]|eukprot:XP_001013854.1 hypothetical protein TTHERM_00770620 [Tetrahymena thermophila SB210]